MGRILKGLLYVILVVVSLCALLAGIVSMVKGPEYLEDLAASLTGGAVRLDLGWLEGLGEGADRGKDFLEELLPEDSGYDIGDNLVFDEGRQVGEEDIEEAFSGVTSLKLGLGGCEFTSGYSGDAFFHVKTENIGKIQVYVEEGCLYLRGIRKSLGTELCRILLMIPEQAKLQNVELDLGAGSVSLVSFTADQVGLKAGAGRIAAKGIQAERLAVSVGAGETVAEALDVGELNVSVSAGRFQGTGEVGGNVYAECAMGSIGLKLPSADKSDFDYELDCVAGTIRLGDDKYSEVGLEKSIDHHAGKKMELECSMGEIRIDFE